MNPLGIKKGTKAVCLIDFHPIFEEGTILTFVKYNGSDKYLFEGKVKNLNRNETYYLMVNHFELLKNNNQLEFDFT